MNAVIVSPAGLPATAAPTDAAAMMLTSAGTASSVALPVSGGKPHPLSFPAALAELAADTTEQVGSCISDDSVASRTPSSSPADGAQGARTHDAHAEARNGPEDDSRSRAGLLPDAPTPPNALVTTMTVGRSKDPHQTRRNGTEPSADELATPDAATMGFATAGAPIGVERLAPTGLGQAAHADCPAPGIAPAGRPADRSRNALATASVPSSVAPTAPSARPAEHPLPVGSSSSARPPEHASASEAAIPFAITMPTGTEPVTNALSAARSAASHSMSGAVRSSTPDVSIAPGLAALKTRPVKESHDERMRVPSAVADGPPAAGILDRGPVEASALAGTVQVVTAASTSVPTSAAAPAVPLPAALPDQQPTLLNSIAELRARPDGFHELNVTLHPAELGAVHVRATLSAGTLDVTVACADAGARDAVTAALPVLHHELGSMTSLDVRLAHAGTREATPQASAGSRDGTGDRPGHREHPPEQRPRTSKDAADSAASFERWM